LLDYILHLDKHLSDLIRQFGPSIYGLFFAIVFAETGLVFMPFLPGDSLLFAAGILAGPQHMALNPWITVVVFVTAAITGDNVNYFVGSRYGRKLFSNPKSKLFKRSHLEKTEAFFERYGVKTVLLARFVPIVRTVAPFVAGMGQMPYRTFLRYSILGSLLWVNVCVWFGYFFGQIPAVKENFELAILFLVAISVLPILFEVIRHRLAAKRMVPPAEGKLDK
jgi:membrane-associated protein